jgi:hypothetical protein
MILAPFDSVHPVDERVLASVADHFTTSDFVLHLGEIAFSLIWLAVFVVVLLTGATALRAGIYLGATYSPVLWDWILGQDWLFRLTYDERLVSLFTIDGRAEPTFAPLAYGMFFGGATILALHYRGWLEQRLGRWLYLVCGLALGLADLVAEGFAVSVLRMWVFDYQESWLIWGVPITTALWVGLVQAGVLYAVFSFARLIEDQDGNKKKDKAPAGTWWVSLLIPPGASYVAVTVLAFIVNTAKPW